MTVKKLTMRQKILVAGTLFGMFFGAGNLIFPVHLGQLAGRNVIPAIIGFIVTAVGIPIFGVAAIGITHSDGLQTLSSKVGKGYGIFFTCLLYLTIGPLFAIPRCARLRAKERRVLLPCREPGGRGRELHREIADRDLQKRHERHCQHGQDPERPRRRPQELSALQDRL